jgi:ribosomal protein S18 acetylase RimI-like enzyme
MRFDIIEIADPAQKSAHAEKILRSLPEWFGNENSILEYIKGVADLPLWMAADEDGNCVGFLSVKIHYGHTGDIYVCGILPEYHRMGIGRRLFSEADVYFERSGCRYVIVKTLSERAEYEPYDATRRFYESLGFEPLVTLTEMWDQENPCLIMIKTLKNAASRRKGDER